MNKPGPWFKIRRLDGSKVIEGTRGMTCLHGHNVEITIPKISVVHFAIRPCCTDTDAEAEITVCGHVKDLFPVDTRQFVYHDQRTTRKVSCRSCIRTGRVPVRLHPI